MAVAGAVVVCLAGCGTPAEAPEAAPDRPTVFVSIAPLAWLTGEVGGDAVAVEVLVPADSSPATYDVTPRQMGALREAELFFRVGLPYERSLLPRIEATEADLTMVDLREGIELRRMAEHHHHHHAGEHGEAHAHDGEWAYDPHVWLDPDNMARMAETMAEALAAARPDEAAAIRANADAVRRELEGLDADVAEMLAPVAGRRMYVYHPAFGYFAEAYGLEQVALEQAGKRPGLRRAEALAEALRADDVGALFVQPQFGRREARALAEQGGVEVVTLDPLARAYPENLRRMAQAVRDQLARGTAAP
jgi:zinc transport system substrate-binding protein